MKFSVANNIPSLQYKKYSFGVDKIKFTLKNSTFYVNNYIE